MEIPWLAVIAVAIVIAIILSVRNRSTGLTAPCPQCEANQVTEINREIIGTRAFEIVGPGTGAGADIRLQYDLLLTFKCQSCGLQFTHEFTQTQ